MVLLKKENLLSNVTDESDLKMRVDYSDELDGNGKLQSGKDLELFNLFEISMKAV